MPAAAVRVHSSELLDDVSPSSPLLAPSPLWPGERVGHGSMRWRARGGRGTRRVYRLEFIRTRSADGLISSKVSKPLAPTIGLRPVHGGGEEDVDGDGQRANEEGPSLWGSSEETKSIH